MFSLRIRKNYPFISLYGSTNTKQSKDLIRIATVDQLNTIFEIIFNTLEGYPKLNPSEIKYLKKYKKLFETLVNKQETVAKRKEVILKHNKLIIKILQPFFRLSKKEKI